MIEKLQAITDHFGKYHQMIKLGEEVGELNKAILRYEDGYTRTTYEILEELSDVYVLLAQIKQIYNLDEDEINMIMQMKVDRTIEKYYIE